MKKNGQKVVRNVLLAGSIALAASLGASCSNTSTSTTTTTDSTTVSVDTAKGKKGEIKPMGAAPAWAPDIKPEMQAVIEKLASYGDRPVETLTPQDRKNHTPTDAVMDLMKENGLVLPAPRVDTMGQDIPVAGGKIHARIYTPKEGTAPYPVIVYYHGGGFVIADIDVYNGSAQGMAELTGAVVVSVEYRKAPENKFPAAHNDAFAAYQWVLANAASIKGDVKKVAVMGESAGGNLAANVSIMARDKKIALPVCQVLVYPVAGADTNTASYQKNADAKPLNRAMMNWFVKHYLKSMNEAKDPRINLVGADLRGLEQTVIITAGIDPLQSEGMMLADKLKAAGVSTDSKNYDGVTHEFFGMAPVVPQAKDAQGYAADQLKKAFK